MKNLLSLVLIAQINLFAETSWSSPIAINNGSTLLGGSGESTYVLLNNSGTALTFFLNAVMANPQLFVTNSSNFGTSWETPSQLNTNSLEHYDFSMSGSTFISLNQQGRAVFSWADVNAAETMGTLKAALFDSSSGWSVTDLDSLTRSMSQPNGNTTTFIGNENSAAVSWIKNTGGNNFNLKSSFNTGSGWTTKTIASITNNMNSTPSLFLSMSPSGEYLFATWTQDNTPMTTKSLNVSRYDFGSGTWGAPTMLSSSSANPDFSPLIVNDSGTAIAQWVENDTVNPKLLKTNIYQNGAWGSETTHSMIPSMDSLEPGPLSLNDQGHALIFWFQTVSNNRTLKFAFFDGSTWSSPTDLFTNLMGSAEASFVLNNSDLALFVYPDSDGLKAGHSELPSTMFSTDVLDVNTPFASPLNGLIINNQGTGLATWFSGDMMTGLVSVKTAFFSSGTWKTFDIPGSTSPVTSRFFIIPSCGLSSQGNSLVAWGQQGSTLFYVSTNSSSSGPTPPSEASGYQTFSQFDISTDIINVLSWKPSTTPNVSYRIYRNGMLVGTSYTPSYDDHQQTPGKVVNYSITTVDESGSQSAPILFTVAPLKQ